jgi:hypothetical protein
MALQLKLKDIEMLYYRLQKGIYNLKKSSTHLAFTAN